MLEVLLSLLSGGNGLLMGLGAILAIVVGAFFKGRSSGAQRVRDQQAADRLKARTEADRIDQAVAGRDPAKNREELKRW